MKAISFLLAVAAPALSAQDTVVTGPPLAWPRRPAYEVLVLIPQSPIPIGRTVWGHAQVFDSVNNRFHWPVHWTSSDPKVLSVGATGDSAVPIRGLRPGRVIVTVASGPAIASEIVYVGRLPLARTVSVVPATAQLHVGDDIRLLAEPRDPSGRMLPGQFMTWKSSDTRILREVGRPTLKEIVFHAVAPGDALVTAEVNGRSAFAHIHVEPPQ